MEEPNFIKIVFKCLIPAVIIGIVFSFLMAIVPPQSDFNYAACFMLIAFAEGIMTIGVYGDLWDKYHLVEG